MNDFAKTLTEVEAFLKRMDDESIRKIPKSVWKYIDKNKDKNYEFKIVDLSLDLAFIESDTLFLLNYFCYKYILDGEDKKTMKEIYNIDKKFANANN